MSSTGGAPADGGASCGANTCNTTFFTCCGDTCANLDNDPFHCGKCDTTCSKGEMCLSGKCQKPACIQTNPPQPVCDPPGVCCGTACCGPAELCCSVSGSVTLLYGCFDPSQYGGTCPKGNPGAVCASPETPIATEDGERAIATLRAGDRVYSVDHGRVVAVPILATHRTPVHDHAVVHVELASGAMLDVSAGHPTADGRRFSDLRPGDRLSGAEIKTVRLVPYGAAYTYDILPASDSGTYFAGGVLLGSTLGGAALDARGVDFSMLSMPQGR